MEITAINLFRAALRLVRYLFYKKKILKIFTIFFNKSGNVHTSHLRDYRQYVCHVWSDEITPYQSGYWLLLVQ